VATGSMGELNLHILNGSGSEPVYFTSSCMDEML